MHSYSFRWLIARPVSRPLAQSQLRFGRSIGQPLLAVLSYDAGAVRRLQSVLLTSRVW